MGPSLDTLPIELLYHIIAYFDEDTFRQSLLALSRALPRTSVPTHFIFERIHLRHGDQVFQLYRRLRHAPEDAARVREFSFESWTVDADIFVNLMALLPNLKYLKMYIGPNFAPEHMEEIFQRPRTELRYLSMRFRPYVQRATYYQFLKGAYFDSTLFALSSWPKPSLPVLSIVQDPLDPAIAPTNFAQPLVFFRLDPLSSLAVSPLADNLEHLRLRVPARAVTRHLYSALHSFPALKFLDLSTSNVGAHDVAGLMGHLRDLQVLVLDGCPIVSQRIDIQLDAGDPFIQWAELGEAMALSGHVRALEREKKLRAWSEAYYANEREEEAARKGKKGKRGRKGLATATISLRAPEQAEAVQPSRDIPPARIPRRDERVRVLPPVPRLRALATSFAGALDGEAYGAVREEFERGWAVGIARLQTVRSRFLTNWHNGSSRVVRFADKYSPEWEEEAEYGEEGLVGLVDVVEENEFVVDVASHACPHLCIAGPKRDAAHIEGCGHGVGWDIYKDEI
ncbi:hypothetical protein BD413DRAFT_465462 [Trametes elegans]|nr:hypothetical protein BD413DRAFT_465462 [Trametes elegans]